MIVVSFIAGIVVGTLLTGILLVYYIEKGGKR